jgi:hypothetical protein
LEAILRAGFFAVFLTGLAAVFFPEVFFVADFTAFFFAGAFCSDNEIPQQ